MLSRILVILPALAAIVSAQGTLADYQRAHDLQSKAHGLVINQAGPVAWIGDSDHFWYSKTVKGGTEFMWVDATTGAKHPAFDHEKLAAAINAASGGHYTALALPFAPPQGGRGGGAAAGRGPFGTLGSLTFIDNEQSIRFGADGYSYTCTLSDYKCTKGAALTDGAGGRGARGGAPEAQDPAPYFDPDAANVATEAGGDPVDGLEFQPFPQAGGGGGRNGALARQPACAPARTAQTAGRGGRAGRGAVAATTAQAGVGSQILGQVAGAPPDSCASFDGKWEALIENYNVFLKKTGSNDPATPLSFDGSEGNYYTLRSVAWSPDSRHLVAYHTRPGYDREVTAVRL